MKQTRAVTSSATLQGSDSDVVDLREIARMDAEALCPHTDAAVTAIRLGLPICMQMTALATFTLRTLARPGISGNPLPLTQSGESGYNITLAIVASMHHMLAVSAMMSVVAIAKYYIDVVLADHRYL